MSVEFPYLSSTTRIGEILEKIIQAQTPPKFTHNFLYENLGFKGTGDRPIIKILKTLKFLTSDSVPTQRYNHFRAQGKGSTAMADGIREGWSEIFLSNEKANEQSQTQLKEIFKSVSGKSDAVSEKLASTFRKLCEFADFASNSETVAQTEDIDEIYQEQEKISGHKKTLDFHSDIHVHLPTTSDTSVYTAIFRALREELLD